MLHNHFPCKNLPVSNGPEDIESRRVRAAIDLERSGSGIPRDYGVEHLPSVYCVNPEQYIIPEGSGEIHREPVTCRVGPEFQFKIGN